MVSTKRCSITYANIIYFMGQSNTELVIERLPLMPNQY